MLQTLSVIKHKSNRAVKIYQGNQLTRSRVDLGMHSTTASFPQGAIPVRGWLVTQTACAHAYHA